MKGLSKILAGIGILLVLYAIIGRFIGGTTIGFGIIPLPTKSALIFANSIMLVSIVMKQMSK